MCIEFGLWMPPSESNPESDYKTITCSSQAAVALAIERIIIIFV